MIAWSSGPERVNLWIIWGGSTERVNIQIVWCDGTEGVNVEIAWDAVTSRFTQALPRYVALRGLM